MKHMHSKTMVQVDLVHLYWEKKNHDGWLKHFIVFLFTDLQNYRINNHSPITLHSIVGYFLKWKTNASKWSGKNNIRHWVGSLCCNRHDIWLDNDTNNISEDHNGNVFLLHSFFYVDISKWFCGLARRLTIWSIYVYVWRNAEWLD